MWIKAQLAEERHGMPTVPGARMPVAHIGGEATFAHWNLNHGMPHRV
jgi:hypothetical protein